MIEEFMMSTVRLCRILFLLFLQICVTAALASEEAWKKFEKRDLAIPNEQQYSHAQKELLEKVCLENNLSDRLNALCAQVKWTTEERLRIERIRNNAVEAFLLKYKPMLMKDSGFRKDSLEQGWVKCSVVSYIDVACRIDGHGDVYKVFTAIGKILPLGEIKFSQESFHLAGAG